MTMGIRVSAGMRFRAKLHPTQSARLAVDESGLRLMMAEGGKAKLGTSRRFFTCHLPPATCLVLHKIEVRRLVVADGVDLVFVFTSAFSPQPSAFKMAPSVMDSPMRDFWLLS